MTQSTYRGEPDAESEQLPEYREFASIRPGRDVRQRSRRPPSERDEGGGWMQGYASPWLGVLAVTLGAGALFAWYGTKGAAGDKRSGAREQRRHLPRDETDQLIASNKVEGTAVYDRNGEKIGTVYNFMVGKRSGRVSYAVVSFGGFLGFGGGYHPLPWNALTYDEDQGGYVVNIDKDRLREAPKHQEDEDPFSNPAYGRQVTEYWLVLQ